MMMNEYYGYQEQLETQYGSKSIVFMMVGSFYETYQFEALGKASEISPLMNIVLTRRNKQKPLSLNNPLMCGFPSYCLKKYLDILIRDHGYTIGIVDQIEGDNSSSSKGKTRIMDRIYGPSIPYEFDFLDAGTDHSDPGAMLNPTVERKGLLVMEIHHEKRHPILKKPVFHLSMAVFDLVIGSVSITETALDDTSDIHRQLQKWCSEFGVVEIVHLQKGKELLDPLFDPQQNDDFSSIRIHCIKNPDSKYSLLDFQQKVLHTIYNTTNEHIIEEFHLERYPILIKLLVYGADFLHAQCPLLTRKLSIPHFISDDSHSRLNMDLHVFFELDVLPKNHFRKSGHYNNRNDLSLFAMLDKTKTTMGSRLLRQICFHPISDINQLNNRYDSIEHHLCNFDETKTIRNSLERIGDLEVQYRAICLQKFTPLSIWRFLDALQHAIHFCPWVQSICSNASELWNLDAMSKATTWDTSFYRHSDILFPDVQPLRDAMTKLSDEFSGAIVKLETTQLDDAQIYLSKTACRKSKEQLSKYEGHEFFRLEEYKQGYIISTNQIDAMKYRLIKQATEARNQLRTLFFRDVGALLVENNGSTIENVIRQLKQLDVDTTLATFVKLNGYCRPRLLKDVNSSSVHAVHLRHPIIEYIHTDQKFVSNTVSMTDAILGYIVYGLNSAGKSTLLRAVGLSIFLAQIGMYVPCSEFVLAPFHRLLTKISNMDDLYKKQSTFMFEMSELKHILHHADPNTMVLCDELTSGTETLSATGIMASTLMTLIEKGCRYMMTTHLHTLSEIPEIIKNPHIHICHFMVRTKDRTIEYDRALQPGMGESIYGVEIVDALGFDNSFTTRAFEFRNRLLKEKTIFEASKRKSAYNAKLIMDKCNRCGSTHQLHTHHIIPQKESDAYGMVKMEGGYRIHKNKLFNLQILCQKCHQLEHSKHEHDATTKNPFQKFNYKIE
jgi:DNA mismatch repair protein MutS